MKSDNSYAVAIFGIPEFERELVERIFSLSESRDKVYRIIEESQNHAADIVLVDRSNASAASQFDQFHSAREELPTVEIANGKEPECEFWVKRPFTAMRMLGALDKLVETRLSCPGKERSGAAPTKAAQAPPKTAEKAAEPAASPATAAPGIYKALVVDDSLPVRKQVNVALRRAGIMAEFAEDAERLRNLQGRKERQGKKAHSRNHVDWEIFPNRQGKGEVVRLRCLSDQAGQPQGV